MFTKRTISRDELLTNQAKNLQKQIKKAKIELETAQYEVDKFQQQLKSLSCQYNDPIHINLFDLLPSSVIELCQAYLNNVVCLVDYHQKNYFSQSVKCMLCCSTQYINCKLRTEISCKLISYISNFEGVDLLNVNTFKHIFADDTLCHWQNIIDQIQNIKKIKNIKKRNYNSNLLESSQNSNTEFMLEAVSYAEKIILTLKKHHMKIMTCTIFF